MAYRVNGLKSQSLFGFLGLNEIHIRIPDTGIKKQINPAWPVTEIWNNEDYCFHLVMLLIFLANVQNLG